MGGLEGSGVLSMDPYRHGGGRSLDWDCTHIVWCMELGLLGLEKDMEEGDDYGSYGHYKYPAAMTRAGR